MVVGKLPVPGGPANLDNSRARPLRLQQVCMCVFGGGGSGLDNSSLIYHFSYFSPVWETTLYRLITVSKGR